MQTLWGSQRAWLIPLTIVTLIVFIVGVITVVRGNTSAAADPALKRTADRIAPLLDRPNPRFPVTDSSLKSFQAWVYGHQSSFAAATGFHLGRQFLQLQFTDPSVFPPQSLSLNAPRYPIINVYATTIADVIHSHQPAYVTVQQGGKSFLVYVTPLPTPGPLAAVGCSGLLEVVEPA